MRERLHARVSAGAHSADRPTKYSNIKVSHQLNIIIGNVLYMHYTRCAIMYCTEVVYGNTMYDCTVYTVLYSMIHKRQTVL